MKPTKVAIVGAAALLAVAGATASAFGASHAMQSAAATDTASSLPASCTYPPVRTPSLTLTSSVSSAKPNVVFTLSGKLTVNSCGLPGRSIGLYASGSSGGPFNLVTTTTTSSTGDYAFSLRQVNATYYRTASAAGDGYASAVSNVVLVTKK